MGLYDAEFCHGVVHGKGWSKGIIGQLEAAMESADKNFSDMDLENASVKEDMESIVDEMTKELDQLIKDIESVHFR